MIESFFVSSLVGFFLGMLAGLIISLWLGYFMVKRKLASIALTAQEAAIDTAMVAGKKGFTAVMQKLKERQVK